jgi:hypothetical protein
MKILEITKSAQQVIKQLESLFVSYGTQGSTQPAIELLTLIEKYENSQDIDIQNNAKFTKINCLIV